MTARFTPPWPPKSPWPSPSILSFRTMDVARHWTLPDARVDGFAAPVDIAWQTDVNGQKPFCHFSSRRFASVPQTVRSTRKNFPNAALPGMSGVSNFSLFEPQTFRDEDAVQSVEEELHQQCEQGSGNCALQNRVVVIQIEPADNWFSQSADPDECGQRSGADVNDRAGFYPGQYRA